MELELNRLASFANCQEIVRNVSICRLARKGIYYDTTSRQLTCITCKKRYNLQDVTFCEHDVQNDTNSMLGQHSSTKDVLASLVDLSAQADHLSETVKSVVQSCFERSTKTSDTRDDNSCGQYRTPFATTNPDSQPPEQSQSTNTTAPNAYVYATTEAKAVYDVWTGLKIPTDEASILQQFQMRLKSFDGKRPRLKGPSKEELAWYGWRDDSTDTAPDRVKCVFCNGNLKDWENDDDAYDEHRRWYSNCDFINVVQPYPFLRSKRETFPSTNTTEYRVEPREVKARMDSTQARTVLGMGYEHSIVHETIYEQLRNNGDDFPSVVDLLEAVMAKAEARQMPGPLGASNWSSVLVPEVKPQPMEQPKSLAIYQKDLAPIEEPPQAAQSLPPLETNSDDNWMPPTKGKKKKKRLSKAQKQALKEAEIVAVVPEPSPTIEGDPNDPEYIELKEENDKLKSARLCKICMEREVNTVFLPCGHLVTCHICAPQIRNCCMCRTFIRGTVKTYLS